jgi:hypothetical protein
MTNDVVVRDTGLANTAPSRNDVNTRHLHQVQLARRWNLSPKTLERWRWLGQGPAFLKVGGRVVYRLQDIEAFEAAQLRACDSSCNDGSGR